MQPKIIVSKSREDRDAKIWQILEDSKIAKNNPEIFILDEEKITIAQIKQLIKHFSSKAFGQTPKSAVIFDANNISIDAQNALLKILEEPPEEAVILIGVNSENKLLPTILSRCLIISFQPSALSFQPEFELDKILKASIQERFEIIEKTDDKEKFLEDLIQAYRRKLYETDNPSSPTPGVGFLEELLQAQIWKEANVNLRTILEYLILKLPN